MHFENPHSPAKENIPSIEDYATLPNVQLCEKKLATLLNDHHNTDNVADRAKTLIYDMLTRRSDFVKHTEMAGKDVGELMQNHKPQMEWYRNTRDELEKAIDSSDEFAWNSNPGWFGINTRPEAQKKDGLNMKSYMTIPVTEYHFIQHVPQLAKALRQLAIESDDIIQVKIPESLTGFVSHKDSMVVHFKNKDNCDKISQILQTWMQTHAMHESPRELGRTKIAADAKNASFSELVAQNIAQWLEQHAGKYDSALLAHEAVKHAIAQSQKTPDMQNL